MSTLLSHFLYLMFLKEVS